nr:mitochondrial inner membrane protease ATP23 [Kwoniella shandongensis]KAA5527035.1 mitochondrial inner membrane protease ATP23 [Kwoniella shandongensis]
MSASSSASSSTLPPTSTESTDSTSPGFEKWRSGLSMFTGLGLSEEQKVERERLKENGKLEKDWDKCEKWKSELMTSMRYVRHPLLLLLTPHIRAANLSGDCRWTREVKRGFYAFNKQHQACVKRRAILSVLANPACTSPDMAEKAVNEVWESCFADTRPFDEIY